LGLLLRRGLLVVDNYEYGLDYAPVLDENPWRPVLRLPGNRQWGLVPFALLLALAAAALVARGVAGSGGRATWGAILACVATPLLFYVSSRYRLPAAALLTIPAGYGLIALFEQRRRRLAALAAAAGCAIFSSVLAYALYSAMPPRRDLRAELEAEALINRARAHKRAGDLAAAMEDAQLALDRGPGSAHVFFSVGVIAEAAGSVDQAEEAYKEALRLRPEHADAASNLAGIMIRRGAAAGAIPYLRTALIANRLHPAGRNNLVVALIASGDLTGARREAERAREEGVALNPELLEWLKSGRAEGSAGEAP
jgi:Flp pilus assembly protein TadD